MGKGRVPPLSRRPSKAAEGLTALAESLPVSEQTGGDVPPEQRGGQPAPFEAPADLPHRVRGTGDRPRPPARVARPVLPESFLERVRAAAEAARREEEQASSDTSAGAVWASTGSAFVPPSREAPAPEAAAPEAPAPEAPAPEAPAPEAPAPEAPAPEAPGSHHRRPKRHAAKTHPSRRHAP